MPKIQMKTPLVEIDGDEMTRILWDLIKKELIVPFVDLRREYYVLSLPNRDQTDDAVTVEAAQAIQRLGVGVKCATITANAQRQQEYNLKKLYRSPNATIRAILGGTVFRTPILVQGIEPVVKTWKKPITLARHAYGDVYKSVEFQVEGPGTVKLVYQGQGGGKEEVVHRFEGPGIVQGMHNTNQSIEAFAKACFAFALDQKQDLWFGTKDTISKTYDGTFKQIFEQIYQQQYKEPFAKAGIQYEYTLIDDAVARVLRSQGGFIWACKNYDGDVMSDMVAAAFGSLAMMSSVLVSPDGLFEYEAAHGTVTRHYYKHLQGEPTSTNPIATIFAWSGALRKRGELDGLKDLENFAGLLEKASLQTIEQGYMTGDLAAISTLEHKQKLESLAFIQKIRSNMEALA